MNLHYQTIPYVRTDGTKDTSPKPWYRRTMTTPRAVAAMRRLHTAGYCASVGGSFEPDSPERPPLPA